MAMTPELLEQLRQMTQQDMEAYKESLICFDVPTLRKLLIVVLSFRNEDICEVLGYRLSKEEMAALFNQNNNLSTEQAKLKQQAKPVQEAKK